MSSPVTVSIDSHTDVLHDQTQFLCFLDITSDKTIPSHISLLLGNREMQTCLESLDAHVCVPGLVVWDLQRPHAGLNGEKRIYLE